jgi:asparagine synthase (glutamine-hydrolysing)
LIEVEKWRIEPKRYWRMEDVEPIEGEPQKLIRHELDRITDLTFRSDVPVGVALSGGIDSAAVASLSAAKFKGSLQAFSVGYPGHPPYDERIQAAELASHLGLPFHDIELRTDDFANFFPALVAAADEPIADIAAFGHYAVMKLAADHGITVMLSGLGGDELFWGYPHVAEAAAMTQNKQKLLHHSAGWRWLLGKFSQGMGFRFWNRLAQSDKLPHRVHVLLQRALVCGKLRLQHPHQAVYLYLRPNFQNALSYRRKLFTDRFASQIPSRNPFRLIELDSNALDNVPIGICRLLFDTWLVSNCLSLCDHTSMASSVETRLPLLDHKLVELVTGLRKARPDHTLGNKFWLRSALKGVVPDKIINRPKQGFQPPSQEWMRAVIWKYRTLLQDGCLVNFDILNAYFLNKMMREFQDRCQHVFMVYKLLLLEIWYRKVVLQIQ